MVNNKGHVLSFVDSPIGENSPLASTVYNSIIDSLKSSVLRCINRTRDINTAVLKMNTALVAENYYMSSKYRQSQISYSGLPASGALITGYDPIVNQSNTSTDTLTGQVTLATVNKWSKVVRYLDQNGRNRASQDISIAFGPTGSTVVQPVDSDIYSMMDGYADTFWLANVTQGSNYTLTIQFPTSIKPYVDYLSIIPFPAFGFSIQSVYITAVNGTQIMVNDPIESDMGIIDVNFAPVSWGGTLTINLTAQGSVIGISNLDIGLSDYIDGAASFIYEVPAFQPLSFNAITKLDLTDFDLYNPPTDPGYIKTNVITATAFIGVSGFPTGATGDLISKDTINGRGITKLSSTKTAGSHFYVQFTMQKYLAQTPTFRSAVITYGVV